MGLAERRWAADKKATDEVGYKQRIDALAGKEIALEIDWDAFSNQLSDSGYISDGSYGIPQLIKALEDITVDDLGKTALNEGLQRIVITPMPAGGESSFKFENGVVTWVAYFGGSTQSYIYADAMRSTLEQGL